LVKRSRGGRVVLFDNATNPVEVITTQADASSNSKNAVFTTGLNYGFNGSTWDRWRNNQRLTVLASAARTSTTTSSSQTSFNARSMIINMDVTAAPTVETLTLAVQMNMSTSSTNIEMVVTSADADTGAHLIIIDPSGGADTLTDGGSAVQQQIRRDLPVPKSWRVVVTHSASGEFTYSVGVDYIA